MLAEISLPYSFREQQFEKWDCALQLQICKILQCDRDDKFYGHFVVDLDALASFPHKFEFTVKKTFTSTINDVHSLLEKVEQKIQNSVQLNTRCAVHVGGVGLMKIRQVVVLEDACTDLVQREIENGWRILAICVQPDQRRPDYILGRNKKP